MRFLRLFIAAALFINQLPLNAADFQNERAAPCGAALFQSEAFGSCAVNFFRPSWISWRLRRWILAHSSFDRVEIRGIENLPEGAAVVAANHLNRVGVDGMLVTLAVFLKTGRWIRFVVADQIDDPFLQLTMVVLEKFGLIVRAPLPERARRGVVRKVTIINLRTPFWKRATIGVFRKLAWLLRKDPGATRRAVGQLRRGRLVAFFPLGFAGKNISHWRNAFIYAAQEGLALIVPLAISGEIGKYIGPLKFYRQLRGRDAAAEPVLIFEFGPPFHPFEVQARNPEERFKLIKERIGRFIQCVAIEHRLVAQSGVGLASA